MPLCHIPLVCLDNFSVVALIKVLKPFSSEKGFKPPEALKAKPSNQKRTISLSSNHQTDLSTGSQPLPIFLTNVKKIANPNEQALYNKPKQYPRVFTRGYFLQFHEKAGSASTQKPFSRTTFSMSSMCFLQTSRDAASAIIRSSGSVPEGRTRTRPSAPRAVSAALTAA